MKYEVIEVSYRIDIGKDNFIKLMDIEIENTLLSTILEDKFVGIEVDYHPLFVGNYILIKINNAINTIKLREDIVEAIEKYLLKTR